MSDKSITNTTERRPTSGAGEEIRSNERYLRPAVDIIEQVDSLVIIADLPGVVKEDLEIGIDKDILTIQGRVRPSMPGREVYREFELMTYYRQFQLPEAIDREKTGAEYANGVLTLKLFKQEAAKPRKVEVKVA